jgi:methyl-accepting chemotaxis protein
MTENRLPPNNKPSFRRKQYVVDRGLQLRFARFVILFAFIASSVTGIVIFFTTFLILGQKLSQVYPQGRLVEIFRSTYIAAFFSFIVILPALFYFSIKFSHRIAGPLPKIYRALRAIGSGDFDVKLVLRKHDELKELADIINDTASKLKERDAKR